MKKLFSLLLVAVMLFGMATTAFAYTDVTATAQTGPVEKLNALGILKGYADGTFKPENPITRAEFAAVIVRTMGLEQAATLINNPTKFSDVTAQYAWAYGYINIATAKGVIKGDPNGKFRPADKVSYAEVVTMILRAGGWDAACSTMDWPAGFVMKAVEFGLTKDVSFDAAAAANRGAVAVMTYNALSMKMAKWNDVAKVYENDNATLAARFLNATEKTVIVTSVPAINANIKANQVVTLEAGTPDVTATFTAPAGADVNALLGRKVNVIQVGTDAYAYIADVTAAADIVTGTVKTALVGNVIKVTVGSTDTDYTVTGATVVRNNQVKTTADVAVDDNVTMFLKSDGTVRFIVAKAYTAPQVLVTAKTTKGVDGETANTFTAGATTYTVASNTVYTLNGKAADFAAIAKGQVVYVQANGTVALVVDMYDGKVTGKVTGVGFNSNGSAYVTVNGTNYTVDTLAYTADVTLDGVLVAKADIGKFVNFDVTLKLNADGKARVVTGVTSAIMGKVTKIDTTDGTGYLGKITVNFKGTATEYTYTCADPATVIVGDYVAMNQRADGKVTKITEYTIALTGTVKAIDTANKKLTLDTDGAGTLAVVAYSSSAFGVRLGTWGDISVLKTGDSIAYNADPITYFEVNPSLSGSVYGKYVGNTVVEGTTYAYVNVKGEVKAYESTETVWPAANTIVKVSLDSLGVATDVVAVTHVQDAGVDRVVTVVAISGNTITGTYGAGTVIVLDLSNAVVYKAADASLKSVSDITLDDTFIYVESGTTVVEVEYTPLP